MKATTKLILYLVTTMTIVVYTGTAQARIKCWTNKDGIRECGDTVPPEYAQKGYKELTEEGIVVDEYERAQTKEEIEEARREQEIKAQEEKEAAEKERQDQILLNTFSNVDDIELTRDEKIAAIESSISLANKRNEKMQTDMEGLLEKAAAAERSGNKPSETLLKDIESLERQIKANDEFIANKRMEQESVKESYAENIERFNELKAEGR